MVFEEAVQRSRSNDRFKNHLVSKLNGMRTDLFILIEAKTQEIAFGYMIVVKILCKLLFTTFIVFLAMSNLHLDHELFTKIIYNNICSGEIPGLGFNVIIADTIDDRA